MTKHGGKRTGAGRPKGPDKVRLVAYVLPLTALRLGKMAALEPSLGSVLDALVGQTKR